MSLLAGSVADREHRKWVEKAVPLSNNPYTMENISRRKTSKVPVMAGRSLQISFCVENDENFAGHLLTRKQGSSWRMKILIMNFLPSMQLFTRGITMCR